MSFWGLLKWRCSKEGPEPLKNLICQITAKPTVYKTHMQRSPFTVTLHTPVRAEKEFPPASSSDLTLAGQTQGHVEHAHFQTTVWHAFDPAMRSC